MTDKKNKIVAIIGRPNTGKSTLFNTIINEKKAITSDKAGTTRDSIHADCEWQGVKFELIDTAGLQLKTKSEIEDNVQIQAQEALKNSDLIIFVVDIRTGPTSQEINLISSLRKKKTPVILAVNKAEGKKWRDNISDFDKFGVEKVVISSIQEMGVGDLLDLVVEKLANVKIKDQSDKKKRIKVGIFGKPNAGKSSLLNSLAGQKKVVVSEIPGTTRDAIDIKISYPSFDIIFIDTAGIKRHAKIKENIERFSIERSLKVISKIDIALLVIDANIGISKQDLRIANKLVQHKKGVIIASNKWDLVLKKQNGRNKQELMEQFIKYYQYHLKFLFWAPIIFLSAKTGKNLENLIDIIKNVYNERKRIISKEDLEEFIAKTYKKYPPPRLKSKKHPQIKSFTQVNINPPTFKIKIKETDAIQRYYIKYIEKELRKAFGFDGTAVDIFVSSD